MKETKFPDLDILSLAFESPEMQLQAKKKYEEDMYAYIKQKHGKSTLVKILISVASTAVVCFGLFSFFPNNQKNDNYITDEIQSTSADVKYVYVTPTGEKYHTTSCRYTTSSSKKIDLEKATTSYSPCSICKPDKN